MRLTLLSLAPQLRALRQKSQMTQTQLARESGVSREWLNEVENGKVKVEFGLLLDVFSTLGYAMKVERDEKIDRVDQVEEKSKKKEAEGV